MAVQLVDPTVEAPDTDNAYAPRLEVLDGLRIGLLWNGKVNADALLRETARCFEEHHGCAVVDEASKPSASHIAEPQVLERLAGNVDFLITAVGD